MARNDRVRYNNDALLYFLEQLRQGKLVYDAATGEFWRYWEPRRNWLPVPKRAEKRTRGGYLMLRTTVKSVGKSLYVTAHRVAWSFYNGQIPDGYEINHIDGVKNNNRLSNLEAVTPSRNKLHALESGLWRPAKELRSGRGKLSDTDVQEIRRLLETGKFLQRELAVFYDVRPNQISRIYTGVRRAA